jgi:hypothetical protein
VRFQKANSIDPVIAFEQKMQKHWPMPEENRTIRWPFTILAGRIS